MPIRPLIATLLLLALSPLAAQDAEDPIDALVEQERIRKIVETAFSDVVEARIKFRDDTAFVEAYTDIAHRLGTADPAVIPLLANEAMLADPATFYLATYALALQGTPEAVEALYASVERAENDDSSFAVERKAQLVWGLAVAGDVGALEVASNGRHDATGSGVYRSVSLLEAAAMLTAPRSLSILNQELSQTELTLPETSRRTLLALQAVSRIGHPSSLPVLLRHLRSESKLARMWAVSGLGHYSQPSSVDALMSALHDKHPPVSANAARSLSLLRPTDRFAQIVEQLADIVDPAARGHLYTTLAAIDPDAALPLLSEFARARPTPERLSICKAVTPIQADSVLDLLIDQIGDPDLKVASCALRALSRHETPRARRVLIRAIGSPYWTIAQQASKLCADEGVDDAAPVIRERLLKREFPQVLNDPMKKNQAEWLLDQLVRLGDLEAIPELEAAVEVQRAPSTVAKLKESVMRLRAVKEAGKKRKSWEEMAFHDDPALRRTAYANVGRVMRPDVAAEILVRAFGRLEPDEGELVLKSLAEIDSEASQELVEKILTAPEYQRPDLYAVRDVAAWAARRYGGERMAAVLERSIELRQGRDFRPMIYYALLRGADAAPLIQRFLAPRMRFKTTYRGLEYLYLRRLLLALERGHSLRFADLPPRRIQLI